MSWKMRWIWKHMRFNIWNICDMWLIEYRSSTNYWNCHMREKMAHFMMALFREGKWKTEEKYCYRASPITARGSIGGCEWGGVKSGLRLVIAPIDIIVHGHMRNCTSRKIPEGSREKGEKGHSSISSMQNLLIMLALDLMSVWLEEHTNSQVANRAPFISFLWKKHSQTRGVGRHVLQENNVMYKQRIPFFCFKAHSQPAPN